MSERAEGNAGGEAAGSGRNGEVPLGRLGRRQFLQAGGLAAAGLAFGGGRLRQPAIFTSPRAEGPRKAATKPSAASSSVPEYLPAKVPPPDLKGTSLVPAAYFKVPDTLTESYPAGKTPAHGGSVSLFEPLYAAPPTSLPGNKWWAELQKAVGAFLTPDLVPSGSFPAKQAAVIASGQIGDMMMFISYVPDFLQLLEHDFEELTPYLAGSNVARYPNLAAIPTLCWENSMINGQIWGIPIPRPIANTCYEYRSDFLKQLGGKVPTSGDEFTSLCKELTGGGRWALGPGSTDGNSQYQYDFFFQMFGLPNNWEEKDGKFTSFLEKPAAQEALNYMVKLGKAGYFYPGGPVSTTQEKDLLRSGKIFMYGDGITGMDQNFIYMKQVDPNGGILGMVPPPYSGKKSEQVYWNGSGIFSNLFCGFAKASKKRIETLLQVADYHAAPFGTKEYMLLSYGIEGVDYTISDGLVQQTTEGLNEDGGLVINYCSGPAYTYFYPQTGVTAAMHSFAVDATRVGINNPSYGLYSPTLATQQATLQELYLNGISDIVAGRASVSSWSGIVGQWRSQGGSAIEKELAQSYAKAHKHG